MDNGTFLFFARISNNVELQSGFHGKLSRVIQANVECSGKYRFDSHDDVFGDAMGDGLQTVDDCVFMRSEIE